jgi:hypothetical protein
MKNFIYAFLILYIAEKITLSIILKDSGLFDKPPRINGVNTYLAIFIALMEIIRYGIQLTTIYLCFGVVKLVKHYMINHEDYDKYVFMTKFIMYFTILILIFGYIVLFLVFLCLFF